ncbi:unnamed protein product [Owenia fusiformis]|uniref:Uncharacterized protein n=1 Tax=Owenia fusiformis TaxID=6347 RepID=A0A8J1YBV1_OWEFU|nr:unnamed protein product [Owenia fusiformis]
MDKLNNSILTKWNNETTQCLGVAPLSPIALIIHIIIITIIQLVITLTNGLFLIILCDKKTKLSPTCILVLCLTVADLISGFVVLPMITYTRLVTPLYAQWGMQEDSKETQRATCFVLLLLGNITYIVSFFIMAAIAFERFIGMKLYKSLNKTRAKRKVLCGGVLIWVYVAALCIALFPKSFSYDPVQGCHLTLCVSKPFLRILRPHLWIPLCLCIVFYIGIYITIVKHRQIVNIETNGNPMNTLKHIHEERWVKTIFWVLVVFYGTWLPYYITNSLITYEECMAAWKKNILYSMSTFAFMSSVANPWIYTYRHTTYRKLLKRKLKRLRKCMKCCKT